MYDQSPNDSPRFQQLVREIAGRLRHVCRHMPQEEFDAMVRKAAAATYRWEARTGSGGVERGDGR